KLLNSDLFSDDEEIPNKDSEKTIEKDTPKTTQIVQSNKEEQTHDVSKDLDNGSLDINFDHGYFSLNIDEPKVETKIDKGEINFSNYMNIHEDETRSRRPKEYKKKKTPNKHKTTITKKNFTLLKEFTEAKAAPQQLTSYKRTNQPIKWNHF